MSLTSLFSRSRLRAVATARGSSVSIAVGKPRPQSCTPAPCYTEQACGGGRGDRVGAWRSGGLRHYPQAKAAPHRHSMRPRPLAYWCRCIYVPSIKAEPNTPDAGAAGSPKHIRWACLGERLPRFAHRSERSRHSIAPSSGGAQVFAEGRKWRRGADASRQEWRRWPCGGSQPQP